MQASFYFRERSSVGRTAAFQAARRRFDTGRSLHPTPHRAIERGFAFVPMRFPDPLPRHLYGDPMEILERRQEADKRALKIARERGVKTAASKEAAKRAAEKLFMPAKI